jgi:hypothetical protein
MSVKDKLVELACLRWQMQEERMLARGASRRGPEAGERRRGDAEGGAAPSGKPADRREDLLR